MAKRKHRLRQEIQAYLIAAVVAALIWLYAEANTASSGSINVTVTFEPQAEHLFVVQENLEIQVDYKIPTGKKSELSALEQPYRLPVTDDASVISLKEALSDYEPLKKLGVSIEDVQPSPVTIEVLRTINKQLPIRFVDNDLSRFRNLPQVLDPQQATVRLPESFFDQYPELELEARLPPNGEYPPGVVQEKQVTIGLPPEVDAELPNGFVTAIEPPTTKVSFTIREQNKKIKKRVDVHLQFNPALLSRYVPKLDTNQASRIVELSGPIEVINRIDNGDTPVKLFVELTLDDMEMGEVTKPIQMIEIPKVKLLSQPESVTIRIVEVPEGAVNGEAIAPPPDTEENATLSP